MSDALEVLLADLKGGDCPNATYNIPAPSTRSRATIKRVLEEAVEVLATEGVAGLSFRALARRCDMRLSNLQYYFATQEALLTAVTRYILAQRLVELRDSAALTHPTAAERLTAYLCFRMQRALDRQVRPITTGLKDLAQRLPGPAELFASTCQFHNTLVSDILQEINPDWSDQIAAQKAAMITALIEAMGPVCGQYLAPPEGLHDAILDQVHDIAGLS